MVNKVHLIGRLGKDPEHKELRNSNVCVLSLATDHRTKKDGEWTKETTWHRVVAWGRTGDAAAEHLTKGDMAYVEGRLIYREFKDREGEKQKITEVVANDIKFLPKGGGGGGKNKGGGNDFGDDEIPF